MSQVSPSRFFILNAIGGGIWAIAVALAGYLFGHALDLMIGEIKHYEIEVFSFVAIAGLLVWLFTRLRE